MVELNKCKYCGNQTASAIEKAAAQILKDDLGTISSQVKNHHGHPDIGLMAQVAYTTG